MSAPLNKYRLEMFLFLTLLKSKRGHWLCRAENPQGAPQFPQSTKSLLKIHGCLFYFSTLILHDVGLWDFENFLGLKKVYS